MPNWVKNIVHITGPAEDIAQALGLMRDKNDNTRIDFNNIIPKPERLNITAGGYDRHYVALYLKTLSETERDNLQAILSARPVSYYGNYLKKYAESFTMDISEAPLEGMQQALEREYADISPLSMESVGKTYIDNILEYGHDTWYDWCIDNWGTKWNAAEATIGDDYLEFETAWDAPHPIITELSRRFPKLMFCHEWADENLGCNCGKRELTNRWVRECEFDSDEDAYEFAAMLWGYGPDDLDPVQVDMIKNDGKIVFDEEPTFLKPDEHQTTHYNPVEEAYRLAIDIRDGKRYITDIESIIGFLGEALAE